MYNNWNKKEEQTKTSEHIDLVANLKTAETFLQNVENSIPEGMQVQILDKVSMVFSYKPPLEHPMGCYATPVSLNQNRFQFSEQITNTMNSYAGMVKNVMNKMRDGKNGSQS